MAYPTVPVRPPQMPRALVQAGFLTPEQASHGPQSQFHRLLIASEGSSDTGKTEFIFSAPGPGALIPLDRGFDGVIKNPNPPPWRRKDFLIKPMNLPVMSGQYADAKGYVPYWKDFYKTVMDTIAIPELRTFALDADNLSWDLQKLAEFGVIQGIYPPVRYANPNAARKTFYFRLWESGKIVITTNMVEDEWVDQTDTDGNTLLDDKGKPLRTKSGNRVAKGFPDQEFIWPIRIRHLRQDPIPEKKVYNHILKREVVTAGQPARWGLRILKCKPNVNLIGTELWDDQCNFAGLVQTVYPHIPLSQWGF